MIYFLSELFLAVASKIFLRILMDLGVTSTSSSGPMYSRAKSSSTGRGGVRIMASSVPEERMLVSFLVLQTFSSMSLSKRIFPDYHAFVNFYGRANKHRCRVPGRCLGRRSCSRRFRNLLRSRVRWLWCLCRVQVYSCQKNY